MTRTESVIGSPGGIDPAWKIGIVHSSFYVEEVDSLVTSAKQVLHDAGINKDGISLHPVAGSFEIPLIGMALAEAKKVDALIGFGIIVQGETNHAQLIAEQAARGIMDVQMRCGIPFAFEVLYVDSLEQARSRLESRGKEAALAVMHSLAQLRPLRS